jgi:hypothetical protein
MVVAVVIGLVVLALAVTGGRFGWRHFVANPVVPDTLQGMPRLTDPEVEAQLSEAQDSLGSELTAGSEVKAAVYSHGRGSGYMLFAMRGSSRPGEEDNSTEGWTESKQGKAQCFAKGPQAQAGFAVTFCVRGFFRRAVVVMAIGGVAQYPAIVAEATEEAWNAQ